MKKNIRFVFSCLSLIALIASGVGMSSTFAQSTYFSEANKTINRLGAQSNYFYVDFTEPFGRTCKNNVATIMGVDRKGLYAQLLAAKIAGRRISRIDYSQPNGNGTECTVELVEIAD